MTQPGCAKCDNDSLALEDLVTMIFAHGIYSELNNIHLYTFVFVH